MRICVCGPIKLYFRQRELSNGFFCSNFHTKIYSQHTCNSYVLLASPIIFNLLDHTRNILNSANHENSHPSDDNRPPLRRPFQGKLKNYFSSYFTFF